MEQLLHRLQEHPESISPASAVEEENEAVQAAQEHLDDELGRLEFDEAAAKGQAIAMASAWFDALGSGDYETMRIRHLLNGEEPGEDLDTILLRQVATAPRVITIPANPALVRASAIRRQLRVAAYCRVSTGSEEQLTSYKSQKKYYTDKIMTNPAWTMAGIFADEGITGTQAAKHPNSCV